MSRIASELRTEIGSKKASALANYIVENEKSIGERQEFDLGATKGINLVIRSDESNESWLGKRVGRV